MTYKTPRPSIQLKVIFFLQLSINLWKRVAG